ncbi:iron-containing redox enzyme family protein [Kitasatospora mediocidica]|uniref:iron-containing redox enzyme family protein n=1 Tax=Kitasatospora mediocidica TaxID=58352 RepID=UPI00068C0874|nr:iron-containing redox enzyme family protein [Kitasatospora mediocidica]
MAVETLDREHLESLAAELMEKQFQRVPKMRELHAGEWTDRAYYIRHITETVLRIRLNNEVDTYALFKVGSKDDSLAAKLAKYLAEEFGHESMFTRDLVKFGLTLEELEETEVFPSTKKLMGYLRLEADTRGPAPTTVWDWFVEWYSDRYNPTITAKAAQDFGREFVQGTQTHIEFDESHDHDELMFRTVSRAVEVFGSPRKAYADLTTFVELIGDYYAELYELTVASKQ